MFTAETRRVQRGNIHRSAQRTQRESQVKPIVLSTWVRGLEYSSLFLNLLAALEYAVFLQ
jgi:hypothetical protein